MKYTYTVRGVNKDSVRSPGYNKTGVSAVLSKRKALTQHGEQRRITEKACLHTGHQLTIRAPL